MLAPPVAAMTAPRDRARGVDTGRGPEGFVPTSRDNRLVIFEEPLPERAVGRRAATRGHRPGAGHGGPAAVADEPTGDVDFRVASTSSSCCSRKPRSDAPSSWCSQPRDLTTEQSPTTATGLVLARFAVPGQLRRSPCSAASPSEPPWRERVLAIAMAIAGLVGRVYTGAILHIDSTFKLREAWRGMTTPASPTQRLAPPRSGRLTRRTLTRHH
jgi:hypothetical protein